MRPYLTSISLILFIGIVSSRSIRLFSNEDDSRQLQQETNRRYLKEAILFNRLRNLLDDADDDEITDSRSASLGDESSEQDDDSDENTGSQQTSLRSESNDQDDADDENDDSQPPPLGNQSSEDDDDNDNAAEFVRKKRQLSDNDDDTSTDDDENSNNDDETSNDNVETSNDEDDPVADDLYNNYRQNKKQVLKTDQTADEFNDNADQDEENNDNDSQSSENVD